MIVDFTSKKAGESITGFFTIRKIDYKTTKEDNEYVLIELGNKYGRIKAVLWEHVENFKNEIEERDIVKIKGRLTS